MNANIASLNGGKQHLPIYKVRVSEKDNGGYFPIGQKVIVQKICHNGQRYQPILCRLCRLKRQAQLQDH